MSKVTKCKDCGMPVEEHRYHPFAACLMFEACHNSKTVIDNINAVIEHGRVHEERRLRTTLAEKESDYAMLEAENKRLRAFVSEFDKWNSSNNMLSDCKGYDDLIDARGHIRKALNSEEG